MASPQLAKVRFSGLTDWWQDPHFMGLGVVWFYVTDILMSVASNYIIHERTRVDGTLFLNVQRCALAHEPRAYPPSHPSHFTY